MVVMLTEVGDVEKEQILFWGKMKWHPLHRPADTHLITHSK